MLEEYHAVTSPSVKDLLETFMGWVSLGFGFGSENRIFWNKKAMWVQRVLIDRERVYEEREYVCVYIYIYICMTNKKRN